MERKYIPAEYYSIDYVSNVNAGVGKVVISGEKVYSNKIEFEFNIKKANASITDISNISKVYDGTQITEPTFNYNGDGIVNILYKKATDSDDKYSSVAPTNAGEYILKIIATEGENYKHTEITKTFNIVKQELIEDYIIEDISKVFDKISVSDPYVDFEEYNIFYSTDLINWESNEDFRPINVGKYYIKIQLPEKENTKELNIIREFQISPKPLEMSDFEINGIYTYTGDNIQATYETELFTDIDFNVEYNNNVNAGTAEITFFGKGNYTGSIIKTFVINKAESSIFNIEDISKEYNGDVVSIPSFNYIGDGEVIIQYVEGEQVIPAPKNAGEYKVVIKILEGANYLSKVAEKEFYISPTLLKENKFNLEGSYSYTGNPIKVKYITDLKENVGFTVSYSNNINAGIAEVSFTGIGNYTGVVTKNFVISKATPTIKNISDLSKIYDGTNVSEPEYQYNSDGAISIKYYSDTTEISAPTDVGSYKVKVIANEGSDYLSTSAEKAFTISKAQASITDISDISKTYDGNKVANPTYTYVSDGEISIKYYSGTTEISAPTDAGSYKAKIIISEGDNYLSTSAEKAFTISKAASVISNISSLSKTYDGTPVGQPTYTYNGDCEISIKYYSDTTEISAPTDAGSYKVNIIASNGKNYLYKSTSKSFTISQKSLSSSMFTITGEYMYNGESQNATYTTDLIIDTEYTVAYSNNINAGTATATFTGVGNYKGTLNKTYTISKKTRTITNISSISKNYDGNPVNEPTFEYEGDGRIEILYRLKSGVDADFTTTRPSDIGNYYVKIRVYESTNYAYIAKQASFSIALKVTFYDSEGTKVVSTKTLNSGDDVEAPTYSYNANKYVLSWVEKGTDTPAVFTNITISKYFQAKLTIRVYDKVNVYYKDKDDMVSSLMTNTSTDVATYNVQVFDFVSYMGTTMYSNVTYGTQITGLQKQVRIYEKYITYYTKSSTTYYSERYLSAFYKSPISEFSWSVLDKVTDKTTDSRGDNDSVVCKIVDNTLNIFVLCRQALAIVANKDLDSETTKNPIGTYYFNVNEAFEVCKTATSLTYLRIVGQQRTNISSVNTSEAGGQTFGGKTCNTLCYSKYITINEIEVKIPSTGPSNADFTLTTYTSGTTYKVPSCVRLIIAYQGYLDYKNEQKVINEYYNSSGEKNTSYRSHMYAASSCLTIPEGTTLEADSILIGGIVFGPNSNGTREHGVLNNNGTINVKYIYSYGFVKGTGIINLENGGEAQDILTVYDFPDGTDAILLYTNDVIPIQKFTYHNIGCRIKIPYDAVYLAHIQAWASTVGWVNVNIGIVGGDQGLFVLKNGYCIKGVENTAGHDINSSIGQSNRIVYQRDTFEFYGDFTDNQFSFDYKMGLINLTLETSTSRAFPIGNTRISVCSGVGTLTNNSYKFLPGSSLIVDEGATLKIASGVNCIFFDEYYSTNENDYWYSLHPKFYEEGTTNLLPEYKAKCIINGTLIADGSVGGIIQTTNENAIIVLSNSSATIKTYGSSGSSTTSVTKNAQCYLADSNNVVSTEVSNCSAGAYVSVFDSSNYGFKSTSSINTYTITYNTNGSNEILTSSLVATINSTYILTSGNLPAITKDGYTFDGWYIDSGFTTSALNYAISANQTVYAKWSIKTYTIAYHYAYGKNCYSKGVTNTNTTTFNITSSIDLVDASDGTLIFNGWYIDSGNNTLFNKINASTISEYLAEIEENNNTLDLYGLFDSKVRYSVAYYEYLNTSDTYLQVASNGIDAGQSVEIKAYTGSTYQVTSTDADYQYSIHTFSKWAVYNENDEKITELNVGVTYTPTCNVYLKPMFTYKRYCAIMEGDISSASVVTDKSGIVEEGTVVTFTVSFDEKYSKSFKVTRDSDSSELLSKSDAGTYTFTVNYNCTYTASSSAICFARGTLITMADGSEKPIEEVSIDDRILSFDHETGTFVETGIAAIVNHGYTKHEIMYLTFEDGTTLKLIGDHGLFNTDLLKYVSFQKSTYSQYIGNSFLKYNNTTKLYDFVKLISVDIIVETTESYSIFSCINHNHVINRMLGITSGLPGFYNFFEYDNELKYNEEKKQEDIEKYGLYTYDEWKEYISEDEFNRFNFKYLKISVGKGYTTKEVVAWFFNWYHELIAESRAE